MKDLCGCWAQCFNQFSNLRNVRRLQKSNIVFFSRWSDTSMHAARRHLVKLFSDVGWGVFGRNSFAAPLSPSTYSSAFHALTKERRSIYFPRFYPVQKCKLRWNQPRWPMSNTSELAGNSHKFYSAIFLPRRFAELFAWYSWDLGPENV